MNLEDRVLRAPAVDYAHVRGIHLVFHLLEIQTVGLILDDVNLIREPVALERSRGQIPPAQVRAQQDQPLPFAHRMQDVFDSVRNGRELAPAPEPLVQAIHQDLAELKKVREHEPLPAQPIPARIHQAVILIQPAARFRREQPEVGNDEVETEISRSQSEAIQNPFQKTVADAAAARAPAPIGHASLALQPEARRKVHSRAHDQRQERRHDKRSRRVRLELTGEPEFLAEEHGRQNQKRNERR